MKTSRRQFIIFSATGLAAVTAGQTFAADPMLAENDAQASSLGYKADSTKVDKAKYPKHAATQLCSNCTLYKGGANAGGCQIFPGKQVAAKGWCSAYAAKA
jgi:hypothetical protein